MTCSGNPRVSRITRPFWSSLISISVEKSRLSNSLERLVTFRYRLFRSTVRTRLCEKASSSARAFSFCFRSVIGRISSRAAMIVPCPSRIGVAMISRSIWSPFLFRLTTSLATRSKPCSKTSRTPHQGQTLFCC